MPLQYWTGAAWTVESNLIRITIKDTLGYPMYLQALITNTLSNKESTYTDYQRIRFLEIDTNRILFYGKIEASQPTWDALYGQCLTITARCNLQELLKRIIDAKYTGNTRRSEVIAAIINAYSSTIGGTRNIDATTTKFNASSVAEPANQLNIDYSGSRMNPLRAIAELAQEEPNATPPTQFGYDYYLDTVFNGTSPTPQLHYFSRGAVPSGGALVRGLTVQYGLAAQTNQAHQMLPDYTFDIASNEIVTIAKIEYVSQVTDTTETLGETRILSVILLNITGPSGAFTVGETITGGTSGVTAIVQTYNANYLIVSNWSGFFTVGEIITGGLSLQTATVATHPRRTIEGDVEYLYTGQRLFGIGEARDKAEQILRQTRGGIVRGEFQIIGWPYYTLTGTHTGANNAAILTDAAASFLASYVHIGDVIDNLTDGSSATITGVTANTITGILAGGTDNDWDTGDSYRVYKLVRTGHLIRVIKNTGGTDTNTFNEDMVVTAIEYDEGPGIKHARIYVMKTTLGKTVSDQVLASLKKESETAAWVGLSTASTVRTDSTGYADPGDGVTLLDSRFLKFASGGGRVRNTIIMRNEGTTGAGANGILSLESLGDKGAGANNLVTILGLEDELSTIRVESLTMYLQPNNGVAGGTIELTLGLNGFLQPDAAGNSDLGVAARYWRNIYGDNLYAQEIRRRSGAGGDIGDSANYFSRLWIGQTFNYIGGSAGDMDFSVKNTAGSGTVLGMYIQDGDNPILTIGGAASLKMSTRSLYDLKTRTTAPLLADLQVGEIVLGTNGAEPLGATDGRIWIKPNASAIYQFQSVTRIT